MNDSFGRHTIAVGGEMAVADTRPLGRARAISGLISEEALASERLGRLTDKVAAALLDANLFSILLPQADGGLGGTRVELFETVEEIARADGSAGWCVGAVQRHQRLHPQRHHGQGTQGDIRKRSRRLLGDVAA